MNERNDVQSMTVTEAEALVRADVRAARAGAVGRRPDPVLLARVIGGVLPLLGADNPVASVARRHCRSFGHTLLSGSAVACGRCWARAIRDDEAFVLDWRLTERDQRPNTRYVDQIAVERFMGGETLPLTEVERREVARRMRQMGSPLGRIARRVRRDPRTVCEWLGLPVEAPAPFPAGSAVRLGEVA